MSVYELLFVEYNYTKLALDIENTIGWNDEDFDNAFIYFQENFITDEHPLKKYFVIEEPFEYELMINLESAFKHIAFSELSKQIFKDR